MFAALLVAAAAALAVCAALVAAVPAGASSGGVAPPSGDPGGTSADGTLQLTARRIVLLGSRVRLRGVAQRAAGRDVALAYRLPGGTWARIATVAAGDDGSFSTIWKPARTGPFEVRALVARGDDEAQAASASSASRTVGVYKPSTASWYGPGFYGNRTACGIVLKPETVGVAHKKLPCGKRVSVAYKGRSIVVAVIDRGPYVRGIDWDLTEATARQIGMTGTSRVGVMPLARGW